MRAFHSIKTRVALAATVLFIAAMAVITAIQVHQLHTESARILSEQQFLLVSRTAEEISEKLETRRMIVGSEAAILPAAHVLDDRFLHARFDENIALRSLFDNFAVVAANGRVIYTTSETSGWRTVNVSDRPYFKAVMQRREPLISFPYLSKLQDRPRVAVAAPVMDSDGNIGAILVGSLDLFADNFLGRIGDAKIGTSGYFYIVANGPDPVYITHHIKNRIMQSALPSAKQNPSLMRALQGFEGNLEGVNSLGIRGLFTFKRLQSVNWILAAVLPADEAYGPIQDVTKTTLLLTVAIAVIVACGIWAVTYWLLTPLEILRNRMESAISTGDKESVLEVPRHDEIGRLTRKFNELMAARDHAEEELAHAARHDALTQLPNRVLFGDRLQQTLARSARNRQPMAVMYVDADCFKKVNDTFGHAAGDELLMQFGNRLTDCVRATDTVARLGGDEFAVILENIGSIEVAERIAEKIVDAMRKPFALSIGEARVTASIGLAYFEGGRGHDVEAILMVADAALYRTKSAGRNGYQIGNVSND